MYRLATKRTKKIELKKTRTRAETKTITCEIIVTYCVR